MTTVAVVEQESEPSYSDDDIYALFGVEDTDTTSEAMEPIPTAPVAIQDQREESSDPIMRITPSPSEEDEQEDTEVMMPIPPAPDSEEQDSVGMVPIARASRAKPWWYTLRLLV